MSRRAQTPQVVAHRTRLRRLERWLLLLGWLDVDMAADIVEVHPVHARRLLRGLLGLDPSYRERRRRIPTTVGGCRPVWVEVVGYSGVDVFGEVLR